MTLRTRLLLAQLPLALSLLVAGAASRHTVETLDRESQDILKDNYLSVLAAQRMRAAADVLARSALAHARGRQVVPDTEVVRGRAAVERELAFQEGNITESGEREMTARLRQNWTALQRDYGRVMEAGPPSAESIYFNALQPDLTSLVVATTEITTVNQDAMVRKSDRTRRTARRLGGVMVGVDVVALLLGIVASMYLTSRLTRPLSVLSRAVRRLGQGDLAARVKLSSRDEIGEVAADFNLMAARLAEYRASSLGELLAAQDAAQAVMDSLPDPVLVLGHDGALGSHNRAAEALFAGPDGACGVEGAPRIDQLAPALREVVERVRAQVLKSQAAVVPKGLDEAVPLLTREGTRYLLPRASPVLHEDGALAGVALVLQDVSRLRRFDELKNDLVATVAHEFRTPLTSLRMATHLLSEGAVGPLSEKQADLLFAARDDSERLQGIVDDLLDLSRIQAGRLELHLRPLGGRLLVEEAVAEQRLVAEERGVTLVTEARGGDPSVMADPERARLVLSNLISNALRYTPTGGRVELRLVTAPGEQGAVRFEVCDNGPGIAAEHHGQHFERFFRVRGAPPGGAGLGLYIVKEIVEAHGGHVGLDSAPGKGSTFWFTLPLATGGSDSS